MIKKTKNQSFAYDTPLAEGPYIGLRPESFAYDLCPTSGQSPLQLYSLPTSGTESSRHYSLLL